MERKIDLDKVIAEVRKLATKHPNALYSPPNMGPCKYLSGTCSNVEGEGCIVGRAILNTHPELKDILETTDSPSCPWKSSIDKVLEAAFGFSASDIKVKWLRVVQREQDSLENWGFALSEADGAYDVRTTETAV